MILFCFIAGDTTANQDKLNIEFVSAASGSSNSSDESDCLLQPEERACSTLKFIITNILVKEMTWINSINMDNYQAMKPEIINLPRLDLNVQRSIRITCSKPCSLQNNFTILADAFQPNLLNKMKNITFTNSKISVWNIHTVFENIHFVNSLVTDWQPVKGDFGHLVLYFLKTTTDNQAKENHQSFDLILDKTFSAVAIFTGSDLIDASVQINVPYLMFMANESSFRSSHITIAISFFCLAKFDHVLFASESKTSPDVSLLQIASNQLNLTFAHCIVQNSTGGFNITKEDSGLLNSWIQVYFQNCTFYYNTKLGSGAAVEINFFGPEVNRLEGINLVEIKDSLFTENKANRLAVTSSKGGAMSFFGRTTHDHCHMLHIHIESSIFRDNQAADGGGALYISDNCLRTTVLNCSFQIANQMMESPKGVFIWSLSEISIDSSKFTRVIKQLSPSLLELEMLSDNAEVTQLNMNVQCHEWSELTLENTFVEQQAKLIRMRCTTCPVSFYMPTDGQFFVSYFQNETSVSVQGTSDSKYLSCTPYPPGANCPGNDITAKPNFWGSNTEHVISMHQCPADYCCSENCTGYDQCSGHRTGVLCGSCEENYSLSMLSSECIDAKTCKDHWLWPLVICAVVMYMAWYTFKNDIFGIPGFVRKTLCKKGQTPSEGSDVYYVDKGYFGIVTYFIQVQAVMKLSISVESESKTDNIFSQIESYIELGLNFELTYFSNDTCALVGLTTTTKMIFILLFLFGIYLSWNIVYAILSLLKQLVIHKLANTKRLETFKMKLIYGLVEIMKYTYLGFTSIVFYSLTCTSVAGRNVWFYDGSVQCYSVFQTVMIILCIWYILPYPFLVYFGMKLLNTRKISQKSFFVAIYLPLPVLLYWVILFCKQTNENNPNADQNQENGDKLCIANAIYDGFAGGFRESNYGTQYWEAVLMLRRLLISATILIPDALVQLCVCLALCLVFLIHHLKRNPFVHSVSNEAETFSLSLLCGVAVINLLKDAELNPESHRAELLNHLELVEGMFVVLLIAFIVCFETGFTVARRSKNAVVKKGRNVRLPHLGKGHTLPQQSAAKAASAKSHTEEELELDTIVHDNPVAVEPET